MLVGSFACSAAPLDADLRELKNSPDVVFLKNPHVTPHIRIGDANAMPDEYFGNCFYRSQRAVIDRRAGPVEDYGFQSFHNSISPTVLAAMPNESVMPAPPGDVTMRTRG